jgi:hypothetical protein
MTNTTTPSNVETSERENAKQMTTPSNQMRSHKTPDTQSPKKIAEQSDHMVTADQSTQE